MQKTQSKLGVASGAPGQTAGGSSLTEGQGLPLAINQCISKSVQT